MRNSGEENQPEGGIHHPTWVTTKLFICLSIAWFLRKYVPTAKRHKSKGFCPLFPGESLCIDGMQCIVHAASGHSCSSRVWLFTTPWTVAHQALLSMGILQARILEWVATPPLGDLPNPGIEPAFPASLALQADSLPLSHWETHAVHSVVV